MANLKQTNINDSGFIQLPAGTSQQRPANPENGMLRLNSQLNQVEIYDSGYNKWFFTDELPPIITGGTVSSLTLNGIDYTIHAFTATGTSQITVTRRGKVDYLVVGGGGGSGCRGGGGAGGLVTGSAFIHEGTYDIYVGSGGAGTSANDTDNGDNGGNSFFGEYLASGGGGGGGFGGKRIGNSGASGGGASGDSRDVFQPGGAGSEEQGNFGGSCIGNLAGGGGGAGEKGFDGNGHEENYAGDGGSGIYLAPVFGTSFGDNGWFAGGGGGGAFPGNGRITGDGGLGGGGNGKKGSAGDGENGTSNTGGGGGGQFGSTGSYAGGNGGSGIVLIRYMV